MHHYELIEGNVDVDEATMRTFEHLLGTDEYMLLCLYAGDRGLDEQAIDLDNEEVRADFEIYAMDHAFERVNEALSEIAWSLEPNNGMISIWRAITVSEDFLDGGLDARPLGVYWSYKKDAAEPHWGHFSDGRRTLLLHGVVGLEDVDWQTTVAMNAHSEDEREIRLKPTARVHLLSAEWPGKGGLPITINGDFPAGEIQEPAVAPA